MNLIHYLNWAFRDQVQRSDLNILFQYLFPWYEILSDVLQNHRCKHIDIVNMLHVMFLSDQKDPFSDWYNRTSTSRVDRRVTNSIMFYIFHIHMIQWLYISRYDVTFIWKGFITDVMNLRICMSVSYLKGDGWSEKLHLPINCWNMFGI